MRVNKRFLVCLVFVAVLSFSIGVNLQNVHRHFNPQPTVNVYVLKETPEGEALVYQGNVISDIGERYLRNVFGFDNVTLVNATQWIALGNSTIDQTKTKLDIEATTLGFTRAANDTCIAWVNSGDFAYNVTTKFTATGNIWVNATSLHYQSTSNSDNNMFALASLGGLEDFQAGWNCTIIWVITFNAN